MKRLRVLESFANVDSSVVRCLALAVLRQHVAVALVLTLVALLTSLAVGAMHLSGVRPSVCLSHLFLTLMRAVDVCVRILKVTHERAAGGKRMCSVSSVIPVHLLLLVVVVVI